MAAFNHHPVSRKVRDAPPKLREALCLRRSLIFLMSSPAVTGLFILTSVLHGPATRGLPGEPAPIDPAAIKASQKRTRRISLKFEAAAPATLEKS